jgi:hypothetical protein
MRKSKLLSRRLRFDTDDPLRKVSITLVFWNICETTLIDGMEKAPHTPSNRRSCDGD